MMESKSRRGWIADVDHLVAAQMQEMEMVRQKVYSLEQTQHAIKQRYLYNTGYELDPIPNQTAILIRPDMMKR